MRSTDYSEQIFSAGNERLQQSFSCCRLAGPMPLLEHNMPTYNIKCYEQGSPACSRFIALDLPYFYLDEEQRAAISMGEPFVITHENLSELTPLTEDQKQALALEGCTWVHEDYSEVCDECVCESERKNELDEGYPAEE